MVTLKFKNGYLDFGKNTFVLSKTGDAGTARWNMDPIETNTPNTFTLKNYGTGKYLGAYPQDFRGKCALSQVSFSNSQPFPTIWEKTSNNELRNLQCNQYLNGISALSSTGIPIEIVPVK